MTHPPRSFSGSARRAESVLDDAGQGLSRLMAHARALRALDRQLAALVPDDVAAHVRVAALRSGELLLLADSAAWATRLRMLAANIRQQLSIGSPQAIQKVSIQVNPLPPAETRTRKRRRVSPAALKALRRFAEISGEEDFNATADRLEQRANGES